MVRGKCGFLAVPRIAPVSRDVLPVHCVDPLHGHRGYLILHLLIIIPGGHMKTLVYETKVDSRASHCVIVFLQEQNTYATVLTTLRLLLVLYCCVLKTA